jgi:hypothetical protein
LESTREAHAIHGDIVPPVTFQGLHHQLFVYTPPFAEGELYVVTLMSSDPEPLVSQRLQTAVCLAPIFGRLSAPDSPSPRNTLSILSDLELDSLVCEPATKQLIHRCVANVTRNIGLVDSLPIVLAHSDLSPFNILIDPVTGQVTAVLGTMQHLSALGTIYILPSTYSDV